MESGYDERHLLLYVTTSFILRFNLVLLPPDHRAQRNPGLRQDRQEPCHVPHRRATREQCWHCGVTTRYGLLTPLVGTFLADSYGGRYTTIVVFMPVYITMIILTLSASLPTLWSMGVRRAVVYPGLYLVAFGTGGIKPCVCPFGAEQFGDDSAHPVQTATKASSFNCCFFCSNIRSMLASTLLVWVQ
ncbi:unnamed protein product [Urochloa humidicola]